jgi:TP53 regulating kinase and related kinases
MVDAAEGAIGMEWVEGRSVRALLGGGAEDEIEFEEVEEDAEGAPSGDEPALDVGGDALEEYGTDMGWFTRNFRFRGGSI